MGKQRVFCRRAIKYAGEGDWADEDFQSVWRELNHRFALKRLSFLTVLLSFTVRCFAVLCCAANVLPNV